MAPLLYLLRVIVLGLTGGIGMGKSAAADLLRARAVPVVDTDDLARKVVQPGQPGLEELRHCFGPGIIAPDGQLRRSELARRVFSDETARRRLEGILHPRIRDLWRQQMKLWKDEGRPLAVVVIPLLFETGAERELEATICVACSEATQRQRLLTRGWSEEEIFKRIRAQLLIEIKISKSNYVIWTEGSLEVHAAQLDCLLSRLSE